ncbi:hypothetical protein niasHS_017066 [Heterodera schachtii]|uniref:Peptidase M41 domain-containing protein n=1 Tax=Heterodera schachtii TaxID=97005 RepID=A0ABD2I342_HETSC
MPPKSKASKAAKRRWSKWHIFYAGIDLARINETDTPALTAGHEAGHSLAIILPQGMPENFISTTRVPSNGSLGLTHSTPIEHRDCSIDELNMVLRATMAGKAAEELLVGQSYGHGGDFKTARPVSKEVGTFCLVS